MADRAPLPSGSGAGISCFGHAATIVRGAGNDTIQGTTRQRVIVAGGGDDTVAAGNGVDYVCGQGGNDTLDTGNGDDLLDGGSGNDGCHGYNGGDKIVGGSGRDFLDGPSGVVGDCHRSGRAAPDDRRAEVDAVGRRDRMNGPGDVDDSEPRLHGEGRRHAQPTGACARRLERAVGDVIPIGESRARRHRVDCRGRRIGSSATAATTTCSATRATMR